MTNRRYAQELVRIDENLQFTIDRFDKITNRCEKLINQIPFEKLFDDIAPCAILDFTRLASWQRDVNLSNSKKVSAEALEELKNQITRTDRFKKYHIPDGKRVQLRKSLDKLIKIMRLNNIGTVNIPEVALFAEERIKEKKEKYGIGECYIIESKKGFITPHREYGFVNGKDHHQYNHQKLV